MNDLFLRACRREPVDRTPIWYMRQAGRYQPEYRDLRERHGMLEICRTPELAAQVTMLPVERLGVDAAILFSDITVPLAATGVPLRIEEGRGPVIERPVRTSADVGRLRRLEPAEDVPYVLEATRTLANELDVPLIGFAGAPFTLAAYVVEGGPSKAYPRTRAMMLGEPATWRSLMERLAEDCLAYLRAQIDAGASAVQLFDSWAGTLSADDYEQHVMPFSSHVLEGLTDLDVPRIHFGVGTGELLPAMRRAGATVVGVDWRVPIDEAWARAGHDVAVQGNLDPAALLAGWEVVEAKALDVLARAGDRPGHVFNLGHGVLPETDPGLLRRLTDLVKERSSR